MTIAAVVKQFFSPKPQPEKPDDLLRFEEARQRLERAVGTVAVEADAFGKMLRGMSQSAKERRKRK